MICEILENCGNYGREMKPGRVKE